MDHYHVNEIPRNVYLRYGPYHVNEIPRNVYLRYGPYHVNEIPRNVCLRYGPYHVNEIPRNVYLRYGPYNKECMFICIYTKLACQYSNAFYKAKVVCLNPAQARCTRYNFV